MAHYNLIFQGKIIDGASLDEVKGNVARLFKADAAKTAVLFSGKKIVIKKNLDTESTKKYLAILKKAGAIIQAVKIEDEESSTAANTSVSTPVETQAPSQSSSSSPPASGLSAGLSSLVNYNSAPKEATAESTNQHETISDNNNNANQGLQLAPEGSNIPGLDTQNEVTDIPDIEHLSMSEAESGSLEEFTQQAEAVELPDIENLSMSEVNTGSMEKFSIKAEAVELPDISALDMTEQDNIPLSSGVSKPVPSEIPDISELSMSEANEGTLEGIEIKPKPAEIPDISHIKIEDDDLRKDMSGKSTF